MHPADPTRRQLLAASAGLAFAQAAWPSKPRDAAPSTPAQRLAVQHWAHHRARLYQRQRQRGLLASAATRPAAQWAGR